MTRSPHILEFDLDIHVVCIRIRDGEMHSPKKPNASNAQVSSPGTFSPAEKHPSRPCDACPPYISNSIDDPSAMKQDPQS